MATAASPKKAVPQSLPLSKAVCISVLPPGKYIHPQDGAQEILPNFTTSWMSVDYKTHLKKLRTILRLDTMFG
ncbi:MAG: hypothetical protein WC098_07400 [Bacteroidales bacterium]